MKSYKLGIHYLGFSISFGACLWQHGHKLFPSPSPHGVHTKELLIGSVVAPVPEEILRQIGQRVTLLWRIGYGSRLGNLNSQELHVLLIGSEELCLLMWIV